MAGSIITEQKIASAIVSLLERQVKPSNHKIQKITGGSLSSICPIFKQLKLRFNNFTDIKALCKAYQIKTYAPERLIQAKEQLEQDLSSLQLGFSKLEEELSAAKLELASLRPEAALWKNLYAEIKTESNEQINQIKTEKDTQVNLLLEELAQVHKEHSKNYREFSYSKEEQALQKEVVIINLKEKVLALESKLKDYQQHALPQIKGLQDLKRENIELREQLVNLTYKLKPEQHD